MSVLIWVQTVCKSYQTTKVSATVVVYVEWASRVNFVTIFGDLYQNKLWVISNNLNQFAHLSSASSPSNGVIKMAAIVLLLHIYDIVFKAIVEGQFIARNDFLSLFN